MEHLATALHIGVGASGNLSFATEAGLFRNRPFASSIRLFGSIRVFVFIFVIVLVFVVIAGCARRDDSSGSGSQVVGQSWPYGGSEGRSGWSNSWIPGWSDCWTSGWSYCWSPGGLLGGGRSRCGTGCSELLTSRSESVVPWLFPGLLSWCLGGWLSGWLLRRLARGWHIIIIIVRLKVSGPCAVVLSVDAVVVLGGETAIYPVVGCADAGGLTEDGPVGADEADEGHLVVHSWDAHVVHLAVDFRIGVIFANRSVCARKACFGDLVDVNAWRLAFRSLKNKKNI